MKIPFDPEVFHTLKARTRATGKGPRGGFAYKLDLSVPCLVCAIHAGHRVRKELVPLMAVSEKERMKEEDTATDRIIGACPSILWGLDSRAEYDLNRPEESALPLAPEMFWGLRVYTAPPPEAMKQRSLEKYAAFYGFAGAVIQILLDRFGACIVYDIHSFNLRRQREKGHALPPVFNLGTKALDRSKWKGPIDAWLEALARVKLPGMGVRVAENEVFGGEGAFCRTLTRWSPRVLVLPTEIAKIYMDEDSGELFEETVEHLKKALADAVQKHGRAFQASFCR